MTNLRKSMLLVVAAAPCLLYGYLTGVYFFLIDWAGSWADLQLSLAIALTAAFALALTVYVATRIARGVVRPGLTVLNLAGVHLRIFAGCLIAYFAAGFATSLFGNRWIEESNATEGLWLGRSIEWSISLGSMLFAILCAVWLGKIAWGMLKEIPEVLATEPQSTPQSGPAPLAE